MKGKPLPERMEPLPEQRCMVCHKTVDGYYARYRYSGVCSRACMQEQDKLDRFPGHSAEDFERKML